MPPQVAVFVFTLGILGLFWFERDRQATTSKALWIPIGWMFIVASREVSLWLGAFGIADAGKSVKTDPYLEGNPIDRLVFTGLLLLGVFVLARRGPKVARLLRANRPMLLFFFYCGVSSMWSDYPDVAFKRWIKALGDVVMVMIVLTDADRLSAIRRFFLRVGFVLVPLSVLFIKYYPSLGKAFKSYGLPIYIGVTTNKNLLGIVCLVFGLASLWRFLATYQDRRGTNRTRRLVAHGAFLAMVLWLFSMAHSTTSLACFLLAGILMVATSLGAYARRPTFVHCLVAVIVSISFAILFLNVGGGTLEAIGKDATLTGRTAIWHLVLSLTDNSVLGTGFESFWLGSRLEKIWSIYWWHPTEAHNGYLEVFLNLGWVGVALLVVLMVKGYRNILVALRRDTQVGQLMLAYFVVAIVYNFTEAGFRMLDPIWITFLLSIMAVPETHGRISPHHVGLFDDATEGGLQIKNWWSEDHFQPQSPAAHSCAHNLKSRSQVI